ncbi:ABC-type multidrug transport system fused ATPase/permease subunit [Allocatelliglobosispora scoriae]|uniref:ABC-type multidrug transport system fused ATPase/permease subunit n=1 Tax=Allocatelliglobosispora scoriae TaxID=643052 RepID=A0A841BEV7_9ACTN|nr:ABC transporter ATP-binding protein [Allocatelliglobosispora scoriae]MBB5867617.1 ABC-type multidrug transport system fused ATPase/permease subunit [Allocatelliglobosispora scoriae]
MPPQLPHPDPGTPDLRGPLRYLWWLVACQPWRVLRGSVIGTLWMIGLAVRPYLIARAIDDGLLAHDQGALLFWVAAVLAAGGILAWLGIIRHRTMTFVREDATARSAAVLLRHISRVGAVLPRKLAAGEVATVGGTDIGRASMVLTMTGPGVGAVMAYTAVAVALWRISPMLAAVVLLGVPAIAIGVGPLLRRLERAETGYRRQQGILTTRAGDIVAGLRVLAGVGGRDLFARRYADRSRELRTEGYRVAAVASWIEALTVGIPGLFLATVVWLCARMAADGEITIGQMVAVYGYVAILIVPVWFLLEAGYELIQGRVAVRRIIAVLSIEPDTAGATGDGPGPRGAGDLHDPDSGLTVASGGFIGVAADDPATAIAIADRLGRYAPGDVTWGGLPISGVALPEVRERILVADHDSYLFAGTLREILRGADDERATEALHTASAADVMESLPDGLESPLESRARSLSGGQRQRIRLAQALLAESEVLILIDPTSAVDAHTEARIAERLRAARHGRTTIMMTTSPLLLGRTDTVAYLREGRVAAEGTHAELLARDTGYRALVARTVDADSATDDALGALR